MLSLAQISVTTGCSSTASSKASTNSGGDAGGDSGGGATASLTVSGTNYMVNSPLYVASTFTPSGSSTLTVSAPMTTPGILANGAYTAGTEILVIQMQQGGGSNFNRETAVIQSIAAGPSPSTTSVIALTAPLTNGYGSGTGDSTSSVVTQIVNVPRYINVTVPSGTSLTAPAWSGTPDGGGGGVLAFVSTGTLSIGGTIAMNGNGYRGGTAGSETSSTTAGESYGGLGSNSGSANLGGGGGVFTGNYVGAAGGGGYGTAGQTGSSGVGSQGAAYGSVDLSPMFMGSGGGGGYAQSNGGSGGGIILITAATVTMGSGSLITAQGSTAAVPTSSPSPGLVFGGGGGAGGSIYLLAKSLTGSGNLQVNGGNAQGDRSSAGGSGRIRIDIPGLTALPTGITATASPFFGN